MTTKVYFMNKNTGKKFLVTRMDLENGKIWLKGNHKEFSEDYSKERFQKLGYTLVKEEEQELVA